MNAQQIEQLNQKMHQHGGKQWVFLSVLMALYDFVAVAASYFLALWLRFDFVFSRIEARYLESFARFIPFYAVFAVFVLWLFRMYRTLWRYIGLRELVRVIEASLLLSVIHAIAITLIFGRMPFSYYIGGAMVQLLLLTGIRFAYRVLDFWRRKRIQNREA